MAGWLATLTWVRVQIPTFKCKCSPYSNMSGSHDKTKEMLKVKFFVDRKYKKETICPKVSKRVFSDFVCGEFIFQPF